MIPTFRYPGSKARIRNWITSYFPVTGTSYVEPFAGRGNVFFKVRSQSDFTQYRLNDLLTAPFLQACQNDIPETPHSNRELFDFFKSNRGTALALLMEPGWTFCGKGWDAGFDARGGNHAPRTFNPTHYRDNLLEANKLLDHVEITQLEWDQCLPGDSDAFVYLDPPYYGTSISTYSQIDHTALLETLIKAPFQWALSGYDTDLYRRYLGSPSHVLTRKLEMQAASKRGGETETRQECLWLSS